MTTTLGQQMVSELLPEDMRGSIPHIGKKEIEQLLTQVLEKHPDSYSKVVQGLNKLGQHVAHMEGSSVSLKSMTLTPGAAQKVQAARDAVAKLHTTDGLTPAQRDEQVISDVGGRLEDIRDTILKEGLASGSPLALQAKSGARGNANQLQQIVAGDGLVQDYKGRIVPIPILHGYAEGLSPAEHWAGSYGARSGTVSTKLGTAQGGYTGKLLSRGAHRLVVTEKDCGTSKFDTVKGDDKEIVGSVIAKDCDGFKAGHVIVASDMKKMKPDQDLFIRSALTCKAHDGICAKCAGSRGGKELPSIGTNVGLLSSSALGEKVAQAALSSKHSGGQVGDMKAKRMAARTGVGFIQRLLQAPSEFEDEAPLSEHDGLVQGIDKAPQGGHYIHVDGHEHYAAPGQEIKVKAGDSVSAGDILTDGVPSPANVVRLKGIGAGRRYMAGALTEAFKASGLTAHRRNAEIISKGLINHVKITDPDGHDGHFVDDIVPYDTLAAEYKPREGARTEAPTSAIGKYLEAEVGDHTIGTRVTRSVARDMSQAGVKDITVHDRPPPFEPNFVPARETLTRDPNWQTRLSGAYLEKGFLDSVARGRTSKTDDTSYIPAFAQGYGFGSKLDTTGKYGA